MHKMKSILAFQGVVLLPKVGGSQINYVNRKFSDLIFFRFTNLPKMLQFADLRFADPINFNRHKTSANTIFFSLEIYTYNVLIQI